MSPAQKFVGVLHDFHDPAYAKDWSDRFVPTPPRQALFATMLGLLGQHLPPGGAVLELGTGPGYFAQALLEAFPAAVYQGLDFSAPMLALAAGRLGCFGSRVTLTRADFTAPDWTRAAPGPVQAIVSTWALHDLGDPELTASVYAACRGLLPPGGLLVNGDFVKPEGTPHDFEAGRFPVARHLELLAAAGFGKAWCAGVWETEREKPTTAQNYACLAALA
ncbi:MAG: methyltransferase domain-containing protein [Acidobacteria bacterium]|nr:methyltransferase domain-containing protein [Acidobacteriota bacterium]